MPRFADSKYYDQNPKHSYLDFGFKQCAIALVF